MSTNASYPAPFPPRHDSGTGLGPALLIAIVLHVILLGTTFVMPPKPAVSKSLDVTLATFKSAEKPKDADFLAQHDQQGSGSLDEKAALTTDQLSPFQDNRIHQVATPPPPAAQVEAVQTTRTTLTTSKPVEQKTDSRPEKPEPQPAAARQPPAPTPAPQPLPTPRFDASKLAEELATLEAQLDLERQEYAKRPRIHRINAATTLRDKGAWYKEEWRRKIERVGNLNYPDEARRRQLYGSLRLLVAIKSDGSLHEVTLLESSGQPVLDQAALRIVRLAAPFAPFSGDLRDVDILEIVRTWRFERGDRLSSQ
jgi:protein TonB